MRSPLPWIAALALALGLTAGCRGSRRPVIHPPDPTSERTVTQGRVVGFAEKEGTHAWTGIPFAEPPVGPLRWRAPAPKQPWAGTFSAVRAGRSCPQLDSPLGGREEERRRDKMLGTEDCLTLNVYAPRFGPADVPSGAERLPVMVWIHGGGNKIGASSYYEMARNLAGRHRLLLVTVNYRLGVLGWFHHPALFGPEASPEDRSGNFGTLDLIAALRWVRDNAAAFGGDPGNVTIFGESAGGINVYSLLSSPLAKGLFHRAIAQSGLPISTSVESAERLVEEKGEPGSSGELLLSLLVKDGKARDRAEAKAALGAMDGAAVAAYLRGKTPDELISVLDPGVMGMYVSPTLFRDGVVLPSEPFLDLVTDSTRYNAVPLIVGTNRDEFKLFMFRDPAHVDVWFGLPLRIRDVGAYNRTSDYVSGFWKAAGADWPASLLRRAQGPSVYAYRFDWDDEPTKLGMDLSVLLGAAHGMEIAFVFDHTEEDPFGIQTDSNREGMRQLARAMSGYWTTFARTGAPGRGPDGTLPEWRPWSDESPASERFLVLDSVSGGGIRMSSEQVTVEALARRLEKDPAFDGKPKDRCRGLSLMRYALGQMTASPGDLDSARFAGGACQAFSSDVLPAGEASR